MKHTGQGFTLIELMVILMIIVILIGLLSPAVLRTVRTAENKKRAEEKETLKAALIEYWHDNRAWPIAVGDGVADSSDRVWTYTGADTTKVWKRLLKNGNDRHHDYIDPSMHNTVKTFNNSANAAAIRANSDPDNILTIFENGGNLEHPIVYWSTFIKCPKCQNWNSSGSTSCEHCRFCETCKKYVVPDKDGRCPKESDSAAHELGDPYKFTPSDKIHMAVRGVQTYVISFDLMSNTAEVSE